MEDIVHRVKDKMGETFTHIIQVFKWLKVKVRVKARIQNSVSARCGSTCPRRRTYTRSGGGDKMSKSDKRVTFPVR